MTFDLFCLGITVILVAAWCWKTSTTYQAERAQRRLQRQQHNTDRRYARHHRISA